MHSKGLTVASENQQEFPQVLWSYNALELTGLQFNSFLMANAWSSECTAAQLSLDSYLDDLIIEEVTHLTDIPTAIMLGLWSSLFLHLSSTVVIRDTGSVHLSPIPTHSMA